MYHLCIPRRRETMHFWNVKNGHYAPHPGAAGGYLFFSLSINQTTKSSNTSEMGEGGRTSRGLCGNKPV